MSKDLTIYLDITKVQQNDRTLRKERERERDAMALSYCNHGHFIFDRRQSRISLRDRILASMEITVAAASASSRPRYIEIEFMLLKDGSDHHQLVLPRTTGVHAFSLS